MIWKWSTEHFPGCYSQGIQSSSSCPDWCSCIIFKHMWPTALDIFNWQWNYRDLAQRALGIHEIRLQYWVPQGTHSLAGSSKYRSFKKRKRKSFWGITQIQNISKRLLVKLWKIKHCQDDNHNNSNM